MLAERGFGGLTLRAVAAEMGASTGLLTHYFPNKRALLRHALDVLDRRSAARAKPASERAGAGLEMLRAVLLDILPLTPQSAAGNRIWVASWDVALADPELAEEHAERYRRARLRMAEHVVDARRLGELPDGSDGSHGRDGAGEPRGPGEGRGADEMRGPDEMRGAGGSDGSAEDVAAAAQSFVLGLVVQALFAPREFPPERQIQLVDRYLAGLAAGAAPGVVAEPEGGVAPGPGTGRADADGFHLG
ncbi:TetR/AcrR family transcriptional regulator [Kitasatospora sp. NBC_00374]|uniref:TetR/AcrR family transcriptional regulator n=1 Tax=Kitasatospora sp. NBC_00374 TaxID=2975964 RepID=UPI00352F236C